VVVDDYRAIVSKTSDGTRNVVSTSIRVNAALAQAELRFAKSVMNAKDKVAHQDLVGVNGTELEVSRNPDGTVTGRNSEQGLTSISYVEPVAGVCLGKSNQKGAY